MKNDLFWGIIFMIVGTVGFLPPNNAWSVVVCTVDLGIGLALLNNWRKA